MFSALASNVVKKNFIVYKDSWIQNRFLSSLFRLMMAGRDRGQQVIPGGRYQICTGGTIKESKRKKKTLWPGGENMRKSRIVKPAFRTLYISRLFLFQ